MLRTLEGGGSASREEEAGPRHRERGDHAGSETGMRYRGWGIRPTPTGRFCLCQSWSRGAPLGGISPCLGARGAAAAESAAQRSAGSTRTPPHLLPNDDATQGSLTTRTRPSGGAVAPNSPHCASVSPPVRRAFWWNVCKALVTAQ